MCAICRTSPCDNRCPNAEPRKCFCSNCNLIITDDDEPYVDGQGNEFRSLVCALEYHYIEKE